MAGIFLTSSDSSIPAAALGGYSPPTPKPAIPRTITKYQSMLYVGCTCSASVDIRVPIATSPEVNSSPARRENISDVYPSASTPRIAPIRSELLIRVCISEGYPSVPSSFLKITLVGLARLFWNPSLKLAMYWTTYQLSLHASPQARGTHTANNGQITL